MPSNYQEYVKSVLDEIDYGFELYAQEEDAAVYSTELRACKGHMMQFYLFAEEELGTIYLRASLENNLPKDKYPEFYKLFNQIHADNPCLRMFITEDGELVADCAILPVGAMEFCEFQEVLSDMVHSLQEFIWEYSDQIFSMIQEEEKPQADSLKAEQINLNPFEGGGSYGIS